MINARTYSIAAHSAIGQKRKYTGEPYWIHPRAVAMFVSQAPMSFKKPEMIPAAWLHDVVEDTEITINQISDMFGPVVAQLVHEVTDVSKKEDGNRATRKALDLAHLAKASPEGQTIKLADLIDNSVSIVARAPEFAKTYMAEKASLLLVLTKGDEYLYEMATDIVAKYYKENPR